MKVYVVDIIVPGEYDDQSIPVMVAAENEAGIPAKQEQIYPGSKLVGVRGEYTKVFK